jgi:TolB protein
MRAFFLVFVALLGGAFLAVADGPKIAFERGDAVWVAKLDGSEPRKVADGQSPELSPDGRRLAFNTQQAVGQPAHRRIALADLSTGKVTTFENVPSENCLQPSWSPDPERGRGRKNSVNSLQDRITNIVVRHRVWAAIN